MKYLQGDLAAMLEARAALAKLAGLPRRGTVVGGPDYLPQVYSPGAAGWTDQLVPEPIDVGDGTGVLEIHDDAERYAGRTARVGVRIVTIAAPVDEASLQQAARDRLAARRVQAETGAIAEPVPTETRTR